MDAYSQGTIIAAVHAGWRGLAAGILTKAVNKLGALPENIYAWLGPAISVRAFMVGADVRDAFLAVHPESELAFHPATSALPEQKWFADLYLLAKQSLHRAGVKYDAIFGGEHCTFSNPEKFFSYRRECATGRLASFIKIIS